MIAAHVRRGLLAGALAGVVAGLFALGIAEPHLDAAISLETRTVGHGAHVDGFSRPVQKAGMVVGLTLIGLVVGSMFGVAASWAVGRISGDGWTRSLKLGAAAVGGAVLLPALAYPPTPPGAGDAEEVGLRSVLHLGSAAAGLLLAIGAWAGDRVLHRTRLRAQPRHVVVGIAVLGAVGGLLAILPPVGGASGVPAELLWSFRLTALGTQVVLHTTMAVVFGLLSAAVEQRTPTDRTPAGP